MTHIVVSPNDEVCESLVTLLTENRNVPLFMTLLVMFRNNGLIAAYFVALYAHYLSTLIVNVFIKIMTFSKHLVGCHVFMFFCK